MKSTEPFVRRCAGYVLLFAVTMAVMAGSPLMAQERPEENAESVPTSGTVAEVITKGRSVTVVILSEAGGEPIPVVITPKVQFSVEGEGDLGFLREKQIVSGTGTLTNEMLFVKEWTVHMGPTARRLPSGVQKAEKEIGQSVNSYVVQGSVKSRQQDTDYPEYETLILNVTQLRGKPVYIDKGATVTVSTTETDLVKEGMSVRFFQVPAPGGKFRISALTVLLDDELKSDEYFAEEEKKSSRR